MKTIIYSGGYKGIYDDTLKEGDLITTYCSGIYEFIRFEERTDRKGRPEVPLAFFKQKFTANGKPRKSKKESCCDAAFCRRAEDFINRRLSELEEEKSALSEILQTIPNKNNKLDFKI